jgi:DNA ligase (NAD+)
LIDQINRVKNVPLNLFLSSLGIQSMGKTVSKILAKKFQTLDAVRDLKASDLSSIDGIGDTIAQNVIDGLAESKQMIDDILDRGVVVEDCVSVQRSGAFSGQSFVFTGTMSILGRKDAQKKVEDAGGDCPSSVSKDLTYLVVGGDETDSSKYKKASSLNASGASIKIITEDDFVKIIG